MRMKEPINGRCGGDQDYFAKCLQVLINMVSAATRMVSGRSRFIPITGYVRNVLHCISADQQIEFYVATLAFKALNGLDQSKLVSLLRLHLRHVGQV